MSRRGRAGPPRTSSCWRRWTGLVEVDGIVKASERLEVSYRTAGERVEFDSADLRAVRSDWPTTSLSKLYRLRSGADLKKPDLAQALAERAIAAPRFADGSQRPIVDFLLRVSKEASRNPLPLTREVWEQNQDSLDAEDTTSEA